MRLPRLAREPLVHFALGALAIFAFFELTGLGNEPDNRVIAVDEAATGRLVAGWRSNYGRAPSADELDALVEQEIEEEILYREALRLGLDRDDAVVRRRLANKMRALRLDEARTQPADAELDRWIAENRDRYPGDTRVTFEQIYLGNAPTDADARAARQRLEAGVPAAQVGAPLSVAGTAARQTRAEIARLFGERFADAVARIAGSRERGQWVGPVRSGFGGHLVRVTDVVPGPPPRLAEIRQRVENDWRAARDAAAERAFLDRYRARYDIRIAGRE